MDCERTNIFSLCFEDSSILHRHPFLLPLLQQQTTTTTAEKFSSSYLTMKWTKNIFSSLARALKNSRSSPTSLSPASVVTTTWRYSVTTHTHTHKQKKSSTVSIWHRNTKTLKVSPPPTTETKTVYPQRERERGGEDGERERERVCECVLEEAVVSSLYYRCRWHLRTYFWANLPRSLIILSTAYISPARHRCEEEAQLQQQRYAKTVLIRCSFT